MKPILPLAAAVLFSAAAPASALSPEKIFEGAQESVLVVKVEPPGEKTIIGTGFVLSSSGEIATSHHLVRNLRAVVSVYRLEGGKITDRETATVAYADPISDLAILSIPSRGRRRPLPLGNPDAVRKGQRVFTIGNPQGLAQTFTQGSISNILDEGGLRTFVTDAPVNPGNSGGPLLDENGKVIGVITSKAAEGEGLGFAAAVNFLARLRTPTYRVRTPPPGEAPDEEEPQEWPIPGEAPGAGAGPGPGPGVPPEEEEFEETAEEEAAPPPPGRFRTLERQDRVTLKDGQVFQGTVIAMGERSVVLVEPEKWSEITLPRSEVAKIEAALPETVERTVKRSEDLRIVPREGVLTVDGAAPPGEPAPPARPEAAERRGPGKGGAEPAGENPRGGGGPPPAKGGSKEAPREGKQPAPAEGAKPREGRVGGKPSAEGGEAKPPISRGDIEIGAAQGYFDKAAKVYGNSYKVKVPEGLPADQLQKFAEGVIRGKRSEKVKLGGLTYEAQEVTVEVQSGSAAQSFTWSREGGLRRE